MANRLFSSWTLRGFKTDPGRIYIKYGKPDVVEVKKTTDYRGYSVRGIHWKYIKLNKRFLFINGILDPSYAVYESD